MDIQIHIAPVLISKLRIVRPVSADPILTLTEYVDWLATYAGPGTSTMDNAQAVIEVMS